MGTSFGTAYLANLLIFVVVDVAWLAAMVSRLYRPRIGAVLRERPGLVPAGLFYLAYPLGVAALAVVPASGSWTAALWRGAALGAMCYGTYNLTNQATVRGWSTTVSVVDTGWGTVVTGATAGASCWIAQALAAA